MKKAIVLGVFLVAASFAVYGQGFYLDIGLGLGKGWTKIDGEDVVDTFKDLGLSVKEMAVDIGLKAGYGPFNMPLYFAGELGGIGHRIYDNSAYFQFNSYIVGAGVIFYPIPLVQFGASAGYSFTSNQTDISDYEMYNGEGGFAWNVSAAFDLGRGNHGCLFGVKYFNAYNTLETSEVGQAASMISVFIRYAYREKEAAKL